MKKADEGSRTQIKRATSIKEVKRVVRRAESHGYKYARDGYMDRLQRLAMKQITQLEGRVK